MTTPTVVSNIIVIKYHMQASLLPSLLKITARETLSK